MIKERRKIGIVGVDSGQLMVTDPCYLDDWKADDLDWGQGRNHKGEYSYSGACDATLNDGGIGGQLNYAMGHAGAGVAVGGFGGDGVFPVYVDIEDGMVVRIVVELGEWDFGEED